VDILFVGCSALAVVGDDVSDVCFRFNEALDIDGVVFGPEDPCAAEGVDVSKDAAGPCCCWGTDLFCFCGVLSADEGAFWGELLDCAVCGLEEDIVDDGAVYSVTAGVVDNAPIGYDW
jgi:hypothetical protein